MRIESLMVKNPLCVDVNASISEAIKLMQGNSIRHLPVVEKGGVLRGFVTLSDLKQGLIPSMVGDLSLTDLMIKNPITVKPDEDVEDAAQIIYRKKIGGLPVVDDNNRLLGIITVTDILRAFVEIMGILTHSVRLDVRVGDEPDAFAKVSNIIQQSGGHVISVGLAPHRTQENIYYFRLSANGEDAIRQALENAGYEVLGVWQ
ncbi:CBS domain-containing protein [Desulfatibacillum aliphaticivorans]|uniref:CBS domain-containing protein n=1 Tax=Desulfatibacillum aliphaticivorans TaxID=218208 RepID=UPI000427790C|nr:CBS domain-containing protein [Desulfatibacillum aliphaticivorans]